MQTSSYKLRVKIGDAEFDAEGPESVVKVQFDRWLEACSSRPKAAETPQEKLNGAASNGAETKPSAPAAGALQDVLNRAFIVSGDMVSLRALPAEGENRISDALILLLYGYRSLLQCDSVLSGQLCTAARKSGLTLDRIDRFMAPGLTLSSGQKRGRRYTLNNPGVARAESLLEKLFD